MTPRRLRSIETVKIAELVDGEAVKIVGLVTEVVGVARDPIWGRECAAWWVRARGGGLLRARVFEGVARSIVVTDASGRVEVLLSRAKVQLTRWRFLWPLDPDSKRFMKEHRIGRWAMKAGWEGLAPDLHEALLVEGALVTVYGAARVSSRAAIDGAPGGYREAPQERVVDIPAPVLVTDDVKTFVR